MDKNKVNKIIAVSALTGVILTTTGCGIQDDIANIIAEFNPHKNQVYIAYGPVETPAIDDLDLGGRSAGFN